MSFLKDPFFKKLILFSIFISAIFGSFFVVKKSTSVFLPTFDRPILFFSSQNQHDLKLTFVDAIQKAQRKIVLSIFTLKDPHLISWLNKKVKQGVQVTIYYDLEHNQDLIGRLDQEIEKIPYQHRGLMHRKLLLIDDRLTILGSANFTRSSLWEDDNLICGIYNEELTAWLESNLTRYNIHKNFVSFAGDFSCYLTPDKKKDAIERLLGQIEKAEKKIQIAMYSFTHPEIVKSLAKAKQRGVNLEIFLDKQMRFQNSLKKLKGYEEIKSNISYGNKPFLLHHKCALIDEKIFVMGSTNWTQAGFMKNQDFLIFFENLDHKQLDFIKMLFKTLKVLTS